MRFILIFILLSSQVASAQRNLNRDSFMIKVRPVLNGILGNFYQMVSLFPEFPKELIPLIEEVNTLTEDKEALKESCPRVIDSNCRPILKTLRKKLVKIRALSMKLMAQSNMSTSLHINSLSGLNLIYKFDLKLEEVKGQIDNASFFFAAQIPQRHKTYLVIKQLDELNTYVSLAVVDYIPYEYREDFSHFYFNFVHPVQLQLTKSSNYEFLNRNVNSLNFAVNLLNMNLTKKNKKTPEGMGPYLAIIHNKWNSLLRYYF
jgi:hypothetical protein